MYERKSEGAMLVYYDDGDRLFVDFQKEKFPFAPEWDPIPIGTRVNVHWEETRTYHSGTMKKLHKNNARHFVEYDDGQSLAWVDFNVIDYQMLDEGVTNGSEESAGTNSAGQGSKIVGNVHFQT
jgi:hypothetical protein